MDVYAGFETPYQRRVIEEARAELCERLMREPYSVGQPLDFSVRYSHTIRVRDDMVDVFRVRSASAPLASVWHRDAERRHFPIDSDGVRDSHLVRVRRAELLRARWPFEIDATLIRHVAGSLAAAALFVSLAHTLTAAH